MKKSGFEDIHRLLLEAKRLGIDHNPRFCRLHRVVTTDPHHPVARPAIERYVARARREHERSGDPFDPAPRFLPGPIRAGWSKHCVAAVMLNLFLGNTLCLGGSGAGKSNLGLVLGPQLAASGVTVLTIELSKGEQKRSYWLFKHVGCPLVVIRAWDWIFNLFEVPFGVRVQTWIVRVVEILTEALLIPEAAQDLLMHSLIDLYRDLGVFDGSMRFPTLPELIDHIASREDANPQARMALLRRLNLLLLDLHPKNTRYRRGFCIRDLSARHLHFDLHGLSERAQAVIVLHLVASLFEYRNALDQPNTTLQNLIILEEAKRFLEGTGRSYISFLFSQVRGVGIAFLAFVQTFGISDDVIANTAIKMLCRANHAGDYARLGACMGLSAEQIAWAKHHLRPGLFIFKLSDGAFLRPFLVRVPLVRPLPPIDEAQIIASHQHLDHSVLVRADGREPHYPSPTLLLPAPEASTIELRFLRAVSDNPDLPSSRFGSVLGISVRQTIQIRRELVEAGWISEHRLDTGRRGGRTIVLALTDEGRLILEKEL